MAEFLAIKNWRKYQSLRTKGLWIKDYPDQSDDPILGDLSLFIRGVLQELRRVRGRTGRNIPHDIAYIARATHALATDRPHLRHAIDTLISRGVLVITNQQDDILETPEKESNKENKKEIKKEPICSEASSEQQQVRALILLPLNAGEFAVTEQDFELWTKLYPAVDVMQELRAMAGWCHANARKRKTRDGVKRFINSWLAKAQNNPKAAEGFRNGQTRSVSKADDRERRIIEQARKYAGVKPSGSVDCADENPLAVSGNGGVGVLRLAGNAELIPPGRDTAGAKPPLAAAAKTGIT